jgi:glycosyltransferase involved in cell wall biosynthesis
MILRYALRNKHIKIIFSLDPYAVPYFKKMSNRLTCIALPDGYTKTQIKKVPSALKSELGIEPKRLVGLFFGVISKRKGICKVLECIEKLSVFTKHKFCLLIVGKALDESAWIGKKINELKRIIDVQVVWKNTFVPDNCIQDYFRCADIVLVTHQRHVGSSHVLIRAAAEGVPVLGSNYGLVGKYIRTYHLGYAINTTKAHVIAKTLDHWIKNGSLETFNAQHARAFAKQHQSEKFASIILNSLS